MRRLREPDSLSPYVPPPKCIHKDVRHDCDGALGVCVDNARSPEEKFIMCEYHWNKMVDAQQPIHQFIDHEWWLL